MEKMVGLEFRPSGQELIKHFLKHKILGNGHVVENFISEVRICDYAPWELPLYSRLPSVDNTWYFFSLVEKCSRGIKRTTKKTGFWKPSGRDREIKDGDGTVIGLKKTLLFQENRYVKSQKATWVVHEYSANLNLPNQDKYVLCKLIYKGGDGSRGSSSRGGEPHLPLAPDPNSQAEGNPGIEGALEPLFGNPGTEGALEPLSSNDPTQFYSTERQGLMDMESVLQYFENWDDGNCNDDT